MVESRSEETATVLEGTIVERIIELVLNESKWLATAMLLSFVAVGARAVRQRGQGLSGRARTLSAMNLFYGCMIGVMGSGHILAVAIKALRGTLEGSLWLLLLLGLGLAVPAWWLASRAGALARDEPPARRRAAALNAWLGLFLLAAGPHNLPLAAPAAFNLGYHFHSRRAVGWTLATVTAAAYLALFAGSLIFFASGQSFEQFKGLE